MSITLEQIGQAAVQCAQEEWTRVVEDLEDAGRIAHYHRVAGAGWALKDGRYEPNEDFWCGVFAAYCYRMVGDYLYDHRCVDLGLAENIGGYLMASTDRIAGRWRPWPKFADVPAPLNPDPSNIRAGDLLLVHTDRTDRSWGDHVCLARSAPTQGQIPTYEGNANGALGNYEEGHGVIMGHQPFSDLAGVYRLRPAHFVGELSSEVTP